MIMLEDVHALVKSFKISGKVYMGKLDGKQEKSIGVYNSKHSHPNRMVLGGMTLATYGTKYVTFLVHWNKSPRDTEKAANDLYSSLQSVDEVTINKAHIKFVQLLVENPVDVGTDQDGIYEMVIEAAVIYQRGE